VSIERCQAFYRRARRRVGSLIDSSRTIVADVSYVDDSAYIDMERYGFWIRSLSSLPIVNETADFACYAIAAIAYSNRLTVSMTAPVSREAVSSIAAIQRQFCKWGLEQRQSPWIRYQNIVEGARAE
jgi:hypothetical protein